MNYSPRGASNTTIGSAIAKRLTAVYANISTVSGIDASAARFGVPYSRSATRCASHTAMTWQATMALIALAVGTGKRSAQLPEVPALAEAGVPKFEYVFWAGMLVHAKTPRAIVQRINQAALKALQAPEVRERFASLGAGAMPLSPEQFDAMIRDGMSANAEILKAAGVKQE